MLRRVIAKPDPERITTLNSVTTVEDELDDQRAIEKYIVRLLAHHGVTWDSDPEWINQCIALSNQLIDHPKRAQLKDLHAQICDPKRAMLSALEQIATTLGCGDRWIENWNAAKLSFEWKSSTWLPRNATIEQIYTYLSHWGGRYSSRVIIDRNTLDPLLRKTVTIDSALLSRILENLIIDHNVIVALTSETSTADDADDASVSSMLVVVAFYTRWTMAPEHDDGLFLRPLETSVPGRGSGFYVAAQILWRHSGTIEYHRLDNGQALIVLGIPIS